MLSWLAGGKSGLQESLRLVPENVRLYFLVGRSKKPQPEANARCAVHQDSESLSARARADAKNYSLESSHPNCSRRGYSHTQLSGAFLAW